MTIQFESEQHTLILNAFKDRLRMSRSALALRSSKWVEAEDMMKAYLPVSENDRLRETARKGGKPQYTTVEVPYSYATMLTAHTYLTSVFLSRNPVLQVQGRHGASQQAEQSLEALLDYQITVGGALPPLYIWLLDPLKYGYGVLGHYWEEEVIVSSAYVEEQGTFLGVPIPGKLKKVLQTTEARGYVGTKHYNVRPHDFHFDPRLPLMRFQEGEFVIRYDQIGWNRVVEKKANGTFFNVEEISKHSQSLNAQRDLGSPRTILPETTFLDQQLFGAKGKAPSRVNLHEFYFECIPSDYGLSPGKKPEKWVFSIANENVIVSAQPLGYLHNKYPFDVLEYEVGGYEIFNRSLLEVSKPLNDVMSWLFNSHFYNVRKTLNDQFIVDPSMVVMSDLEDPNPGRLVRLKPAAYGKPVDSVMKQFQTQDVTRQNLSDSDMVMQLSQRVSGVTDNIMGMVNASGRKTATEVRSSSSFASNRLKTTVEWMSATGWAPWTQKLIQTTQQMYDAERKYRVVGDLALDGEAYLNVKPEDIQGFFDFVAVDGSLPIDRFAQANLWQQMLTGMAASPQLSQGYDMVKIFGFVAGLAGLKNISQFRVKVVPDAQMQAQVQQGQSVPMVTEGNAMEPGQIPGMGTTA